MQPPTSLNRPLDRRQFLALTLAATLGAGCGTGSPGRQTAAGGQCDGGLVVMAAASLTEAFRKGRPAERYNFAGSQTLVTQLVQGAPADVLATADERSMTNAVKAGVVDAPVVFVTNRLAIVTAPGNPKKVGGLADLARGDLKVVLADRAVPAGNFAEQAIARAGVQVNPVSRPLDVKATLATVTSGAADAAVVYQTDARAAGERVATVPVADEHNVLARYLVARTVSTKCRARADGFIASVTKGDLQRTLLDAGFTGA